MSAYCTLPCQKLTFSTTLPHIFDFLISETYLFPQNFCWSRCLLFGLSQRRCLPCLRLLKPTQVSGGIIIMMIMKKITMIIIILQACIIILKDVASTFHQFDNFFAREVSLEDTDLSLVDGTLLRAVFKKLHTLQISALCLTELQW